MKLPNSTKAVDLFRSKLIVLSAPSGTGKTSIIRGARAILPQLTLSVSYTTRDPRDSEKDGVDYFFISRNEFKERVQEHDFLEWAEVYGNYYGTSKEFIKDSQKKGNIVLLDIDVQGAMQLREIKNIEKRSIFIVPPSLDTLKERLSQRNTETRESLKRRLDNAEHELSFQDRYDHVLVNDNLETTIHQFITILVKESLNPDLRKQSNPQRILEEITSAGRSNGKEIHPTLLKICKQLL